MIKLCVEKPMDLVRKRIKITPAGKKLSQMTGIIAKLPNTFCSGKCSYSAVSLIGPLSIFP